MAKYSTGGPGGSGGGDACELCGERAESLRTATVAGATLQVCPDCAPHGDTSRSGRDSTGAPDTGDGEDRNRRAARRMAAMHDAQQADAKRWERDGTNYDDDPLPYLVSGYSDRVRAARQNAGLQLSELASELGVPEDRLLAVEQGRAARAGVGGSLIEALEERFDLTLAEAAGD